MGYWIDRERALWTREIVAVVRFRQRRPASRVILRDNSWHHTLTRTATCAERIAHARRRGLGISAGRGAT